MSDILPFTKDELKQMERGKLVRLAHYAGIVVKRKYTNEEIVNKLWDKYYPDVIICDGNRAVKCERQITPCGDEIITYKGQTYNLSQMSVRIRRMLENRIEQGE